MRTLLTLSLFLFAVITDVYSQQCPYGSYVGSPAVSWISNGNADGYTTINENTLNGSGGNLFSDGANVVYESASGFQAGDTILITARYIDTRKGAFVFSSAGSSVFNSGAILANAFTSSYTTVKYVIPAGISNFSRLNITGQTENTLYINIDAVELRRIVCYTCNINIAPALSATTVANICPAKTYNLTPITASNTPAGSVLTWHTGTPATNANKIANPAAANGSVFYAAFYNTANNCYSGAGGSAITLVYGNGDFDCDGVPDKNDIDDDNDGIPDAIESPACFYSEAEMDAFTVTSQLIWNNSYPVTNAVDKDDASFSQLNSSGQALTGVTIIELALKDYVKIISIDLEMGAYSISSSASNGSVMLQGWDGSAWKNLSVGKFATVANGAETFVNSKFNKIRIQGVSGTASYARINEIHLRFLNYNPSLYPKPSCNTNTDNTGGFNHQDLDSDDDGCSDSYESNLTNSKTANYQFTGGDSNGDGLVDAVDADNDGAPDAAITYNDYAINSSLNLCTDSDNDGISDLRDIDDDNDGVLDIVECGGVAGVSSIQSVLKSTDGTLAGSSGSTVNWTTTQNYVALSGGEPNPSGITEYINGFDNASGGGTPDAYFTLSSPVVIAETSGMLTMGVDFYDNVQNTTTDAYNLNLPVKITLYTDKGAFVHNYYISAKEKDSLRVGKWIRYDAKFAVPEGPLTITKYEFELEVIVGGITSTFNASTSEVYAIALYPKSEPANCSIDTDGDGIPNRLDPDSDNDGCPDTKEAGVYNQAGVTTSNAGSVVSGPYGGNGFADILQLASDTNRYKYFYTYAYATSSALNTCADTDGDGIFDIVDIDDDNDGILDTVENNCPAVSANANCPDCDEVINWVSWNSITNSEAKGTMMVDNQLVNVTARINSPYFRDIMQTPWNYGTVNYCSKNESLVNGYINVENTTTSGPYTITVEFDKLVYNPRMGAASTSGAGIDFPEPVTALTLPRQMASTPLCTDITHVVTSEDAWSVLFKGQRTTMTFSSPGFDHQWNFAIGVKNFIDIPDCDPVDTDNDGIPNQLDLDSDGDGCPDALEAGTYNKAGVVTSNGNVQNGSGGMVTSTTSTANAVINGPYGGNGFADILQAAADTNTYKYTYTYSFATAPALNACIDTDNDGVPDVVDLDDDNDGILDKDECTTGTGTNLVKYGAFTEPFTSGGQYSTVPSTHWFYANKPYSTALGYGSPYTVYNYGPNVQSSGTFANSDLTGGLFTELEGVNGNPATGINNALNEFQDSAALIYKFQQPLWAGSYDYSFDLRQRLDNSNGEDAVAIYNVDTKKIEKILTVVNTNDLPSGSDSPNYKNFSGTFTITTPGNYYLLFMVTVGGTYVGDYLVDRVAVRANDGPVCDLDGDGIPNDKDLDSDGDGCPDAIEGGGPMLASDLRVSALNGGNSGVGYTGSSINPVIVNLGNTVDANGVPTVANGGQSVGSSQDGTQTSADCPFQPVHNPDFGVTYVNVPLNGNISTNDKPTPGSTYGNPVPDPSNPSSCMPVISSNGAYTFTCATPGVYVFNIQVCEPTPATLCKTVPLTITVLDPNDLTTAPVANPDYGVTKINTAVTIPVKSNDKCQNGPSCTLGTPSLVTAPVNGSFNPATGVYMPSAGFAGRDSLQYAVCDNQSPSKCDTAWVYITVLPTTAHNSTDATDDYVQTLYNIPVSGNVKTNDTDPQGNPQTVTTTGTFTQPGKGTLTLNADGSYTFVPVDGFSGPVEFPYTTCDIVVSPTTQACAQATLHILVEPKVPAYDPDFGVTYVSVPLTGDVSINDATTGGTYSNPAPNPANPSSCMPTIASDGKYTFNCATPGVYTFNVPVCEPAPGTSCTTVPLTITVLSGMEDAGPLANPDYGTTLVNQPVVVNILSNDKCQNGPSCTLTTPTIVAAPLNGSFNPATGVYTPNANFVGKDSLQYSVCDNQSPAKCTTAWVYIDVLPSGGPNTTQATDDYAQTLYNTPVNGNVQTNDRDPEGNPQIVNPQTTTIPGKGTLTLNSDGSYNFVPENEFYGPVDFIYETCDVVTAPAVQACAKAMLHIMVMPVPDLTPVFRFRRTSLDKGQSTNAYVDITNLLVGVADPASSQIRVRISKPALTSGYSFTSNGTMTSITVFGATAVNNADWEFTEDAYNLTFILKQGKTINGSAISRIGFTVTRANVNNTATKVAVTATIKSGSGGEINNANNTIGAEISSNN